MNDPESFLDTGLLIILNTAGFVTAMLAALFWYKSAKAEVPYDLDARDKDGMHGGGIIIEHADGRRVDPFASALLANQLNAKAAICAAIAAASQALVYFLPARSQIWWAATQLYQYLLSWSPF